MTYSESNRRALRMLARGEWVSASEVARDLGVSTAAATARIRDLRKASFGSHAVECRRHGDGVYRYRIVPREERVTRATAGG